MKNKKSIFSTLVVATLAIVVGLSLGACSPNSADKNAEEKNPAANAGASIIRPANKQIAYKPANTRQVALNKASQPGQWGYWGGDLFNTRSSKTEHKISVDNVANLVPKWVFETEGDVSATPTVVGNELYVPDFAGNLWAVDSKKGTLIWTARVEDYTGIPGDFSRTSAAIEGNLLILGSQSSGYVFAVNRTDGSLVWKTLINDHPLAIITQSAVIHGNKVYVGAASNEEGAATSVDYPCCSFAGNMVALNKNTGEIIWNTSMIQDVPVGEGQYSGAAIWGSTAVVDTKRNSLYIATGNNYNVPDDVKICIEDLWDQYGEEPPVDEELSCFAESNYVDAIMALDLKSGAIKWSQRVEGYDAWTVACFFLPPGVTWCPSPMGPDYDFGQGPMLWTTTNPDTGLPMDLVGAGQKSGVFWALNPDNGEIVWNTLVGPGSALGGLQWGSATDGERIYTAISNLNHASYELVNAPDGRASTTGGSWSALDAATGEILWQTADPNIDLPFGLGFFAMDTAPVTVANGVAYGASMSLGMLGEPTMFAMDAETGEILWDFVVGSSVNGGPSIVNGIAYWGTGYTRILGSANNKIYAFEVTKTQKIPNKTGPFIDN